MLLRRSIYQYALTSRSIRLCRNMSTAEPFKPTKTMVAEIRERTIASVLKAREALVASNGDIEKALEWLNKDRISSSQQKIERVGKRFTGEGLIGVSVVTRGTCSGLGTVPQGIRAAMIELNCETDYVGKNELFRKLVQDLAFTVAYLGESSPSPPFMAPMDISYIQNAPLIRRDTNNNTKQSVTVSEAIRDLIYACSENITFRRAVSFVHDMIPIVSGVGLRAGSYVHGTLPNSTPLSPVSSVMEAQGSIGALIAVGLRTAPESRLSELFKDPTFERDLQLMERGLSRQIVGMSPLSIREGSNALYDQSFDLLGTAAYAGQSVGQVLQRWSQGRNMINGNTHNGLDVLEFVRWEVGGLEKEGSS